MAGRRTLGYLDQGRIDKKCQIVIDPVRAPVIRHLFEMIAYERWSGRKIFNWLRHDLNFKTRGNKPLTLAGVYRVIDSPLYYGMFEYPRESGNWYQGKHKPIITKELFDLAQAQLKRDQIVRENKEFAFTELFTCGLCGSGTSAEEKYKLLKDGTTARYVYYGCTRGRDRNCRNLYIREEELIVVLLKIIDVVSVNELGLRHKFNEEIERFNRFQGHVLQAVGKAKIDAADLDVRAYAKYVLREGSVSEKRELLGNPRSRLVYQNRRLARLG